MRDADAVSRASGIRDKGSLSSMFKSSAPQIDLRSIVYGLVESSDGYRRMGSHEL